ncbi:efflux RND transporter periplasmic adaptor subunit [Shewanella sp. WXL01]|uniref:Efflux RND transporter periplasmic adaptor subunit n=1 Tax=Shewanella maritima TaxID=2520507 RepID=A0A411PHJ0_9GAMM|nr:MULTISPECIES: efflux RND transporter periplasmic adaptor subunit [Shewanella]NKF49026.1 efflux RND transporter periplasmic adaptor subunit [Shewanella sp. WXL01]QBF82830.1 efflux RND transporter periplasmic adaptor subunit [Shewanella maritima]
MHKALKIAAVVAATMWLSACNQEAQQAGQSQQQRPPTPVGVITVKAAPQAIEVELPGRSRAYLEAEVRPQVTGIITSRGFTEGGIVDQGQSLYQIDPATYEATLISAKADLARALAALSSAKATSERYEALVQTNAISKQDYDEAFAAYQEAKAGVVVAEAAINTAEINLQYTEVKAPISGRISKSSVTAGALVTANQNSTLATIQQLDPINVDIAQSSAQMLRLKSQLRAGKLQQSEDASVSLLLEDGTEYEHAGVLKFAEVSVDEATGSVTIRAEFPNPDGLLLPGMYVRARLDTGTDPSAILVPQKAVTRNPKGQPMVMVVNAENTVEVRMVKTAEAINNQWRIVDGLVPGDKLIVEGLQKIRPGAPVAPQVVSTSTPTK